MQAHTVLLLCTAFVLGYARPQGNVVDASGPFGGQHGGPGGGSFALLLSAQKFRSILVGEFLGFTEEINLTPSVESGYFTPS